MWDKSTVIQALHIPVSRTKFDHWPYRSHAWFFTLSCWLTFSMSTLILT